jgi:predicted dehydrogenase
MKTLIIGYGSIGKRHARLLAPLSQELAVVSSQDVKEYTVFPSVEQALAKFSPDYVVVCTVTAQHSQSLAKLKMAGFHHKALVEKPLFSHAAENEAPYPFSIHVAYQLRFHPVIRAMKEALSHRKILSAHVYVGQHLSGWRPGRDHKSTYSASRKQGGGVLRDLSHELDLLGYLFGPIGESHALAGRVSDVTEDSEDAVAFVLRCQTCPVVSLQMNYLDYVPRREWIVNTGDYTLKADLVRNSLSVNHEVTTIPCEADDAYRAMHYAMLRDDGRDVCRFDEGLALNRLIDTVPVN